MLITITIDDGRTILWDEGSHYAAARVAGEPDVFSFSWEKNVTTRKDFFAAFDSWLGDN